MREADTARSPATSAAEIPAGVIRDRSASRAIAAGERDQVGHEQPGPVGPRWLGHGHEGDDPGERADS